MCRQNVKSTIFYDVIDCNETQDGTQDVFELLSVTVHLRNTITVTTDFSLGDLFKGLWPNCTKLV